MKFMDLLYKRYADPVSLLNGYIRTSRFCEFVTTFVQQKQEDDRWEFFLHKVWDKGFDDFCKELQTAQDLHGMSETTMETTVKKSMEILGNFNPEGKEGEVPDGSV